MFLAAYKATALKSLFLVDDDEDDRDFFLSVFDMMGNRVTCETAENGQVAWERLTQTEYRPDMIFLDLNMPVMNGKALLEKLKAHSDLKKIPVIVLSTSSNEQTIQHALDAGAADFITKPNKISILEQRLIAVLENPSYFQNAV
jgi:CheY-like chemotaxis protein